MQTPINPEFHQAMKQCYEVLFDKSIFNSQVDRKQN